MRFKEKIKVGTDPEYYDTLAAIESSGNPRAEAKTSSASGLFQFTEGTWSEQVKRLGLDYTLEDRFNPEKSRVVVEAFTKQNERYLKQVLDREITQPELYLSHFLGMGGARNLIQAYEQNPHMTVDEVIGEGSISSNVNVLLNDDGTPKKVSEIYSWANKKFGIDIPVYTPPTEEQLSFTEFTAPETLELPQTEEHYTGLTPQDYIPYLPPEKTQPKENVEKAKQSIDNRRQEQDYFIQQILARTQVQYIDPNENNNEV